MDRREFSGLMSAVVAGILAGSRSFASERPGEKATAKKAEGHICRAFNECKGKGNCTAAMTKAGRNECKGRGGCATASYRHDCKGLNKCKERGGCSCGNSGCQGRNSCEGKGGCKVPVTTERPCKTCREVNLK
jgi:hypothetical protein